MRNRPVDRGTVALPWQQDVFMRRHGQMLLPGGAALTVEQAEVGAVPVRLPVSGRIAKQEA
jgi:hypothetical protein